MLKSTPANCGSPCFVPSSLMIVSNPSSSVRTYSLDLGLYQRHIIEERYQLREGGVQLLYDVTLRSRTVYHFGHLVLCQNRQNDVKTTNFATPSSRNLAVSVSIPEGG